MRVPYGIIVQFFCILIGINVGSLLKNHISEKLVSYMNGIFGLAAMTLGISSMVKVKSLPAVILTLIVGALIGELLHLDIKIKNFFQKMISKFKFKIDGDKEAYMNFYLSATIVICASATGIFGSMQEGFTGDMSIIISKSILDFFTVLIFAATLGRALNLIVPPQIILFLICFYCASFIMPIVTDNMISDFTATGGIITFAIGLNIAKIKNLNAANLLPCLILVWPFSWLFSLIF